MTLIACAAWDAASVYVSYNLTHLIRIGSWEGWSSGLGVICSTWLGVSYLSGRYSPAASGENNSDAVKTCKTLLAGIAVVAVFVSHSWVYQVVDAQTRFRGFLIPLVICTCILSTIGHTVRDGLSARKRRWILVGSSAETKAIKRELEPENNTMQQMARITISDKITSLKDWQINGKVGYAVGCIEGNTDKETDRLLRLRERGETVIPLLNWCEQELQRIPPELVHSEWLIQAEGFGLRPGTFSWRVKRVADIAGALTLCALTAPLLVLGGICIWLEDRGPIFYKQLRSGLYGSPILIWKLRSMKVNSERDGAQWATKADPRVTRVGRFIRATRIDELPQLYNVLNGDLSLIGPRPERPEIEEILEGAIPNYRVRHWIRPGLSGWAQVCYQYGASTEDSRMKLSYDLYYLRNAGLTLDLLIALKTLKLILTAKGSEPKPR